MIVILLFFSNYNYAQNVFITPGIWIQAVSDNDSTVKLVLKNEEGDKIFFESQAADSTSKCKIK